MDQDNATIEEKKIHKYHNLRNSFSMWWLGMINNFHYTLVLSASNSIAEGYGMKKYIALITWANVFFGIFSRIVNAFIFTLLSYNIRVSATCIMNIAAILLVSFAWDISGHNNIGAFIVSLLGVLFIGLANNYSESVFLGYLERMPSKQIGAWSSGTGLSGVAASLFMLGLMSLGLSVSQIFLLSIPVALIYGLFYFFGLYLPFRVPVGQCADDAQPSSPRQVGAEVSYSDLSHEYIYKAMTNWSGTPWTNIIPALPERKPECLKEMERLNRLEALENDSVDESSEASFDAENDEQIGKWARWKRETWPIIKEMHNVCFWNNLNLAIVYIAEYAVQFMAPFSFPCSSVKTSQNFLLKNSFVISQFCYQFGVLISRSSLLCIRIHRVWILSLIQILNAIAWFCQAKLKFLSDEKNAERELMFAYLLFVWMVFVGLMGGASYVNVFYNILVQTKFQEDREKDDATAFIRATTQWGPNASNVCVESEEERKESTVLCSASQDDGAACSPVSSPSFVGPDSVQKACDYIASVWKQKRDLAMNIGALYATIGITIGSLLDVFFTVVLLGEQKC